MGKNNRLSGRSHSFGFKTLHEGITTIFSVDVRCKGAKRTQFSGCRKLPVLTQTV